MANGMRKQTLITLLLSLAAVPAHAGVIQGIVVEKQTGYALEHATVTLQALPLGGSEARTVRTREAGQFDFGSVPPGAYLIRAVRRGFMPVQYGQKRWNSAGTAVIVDKDSTMSLQLQLSRYGAIGGTVRDPNEAGIPDQDVAAYTSTQPPRFVMRAKTDDRGVFRIGGLEPGAYVIRTTGNKDEDRDYIPTFSRQTQRAEEARTVIVYPDEEANDGDVRPILGQLFSVSGNIPLPYSNFGFNVTVTLASDMGRVITEGPAFHYASLPPVRYEIYAEARENAPGTRILGGYLDLQLERNITNLAIPVNEVRETTFVLDGAGTTPSAQAFVRRKDPAGDGPVQTAKLTSLGRLLLSPGHWTVLIAPPAGYYVARFSPVPRDNLALPEGWNEITVGANAFNRFTVTLSSGGGALHGMVKTSGSPAVEAPVFLETWDPVTRKRLLDLREARTDAQGNYRFSGLPPGNYRVLSTFEYAAPEPGFFDSAGALEFRIESATDPQANLELYGIP